MEVVAVGREEIGGALGGSSDRIFEGYVDREDFEASRGIIGGGDEAGEQPFADRGGVEGAGGG